MFIPSLEAAKITIQLLDIYKDEDDVEAALEADYKYRTPEEFLKRHFEQQDYSDEMEDEITEFFFRIYKCRKFLTMVEKEFLNRKSPLLGKRVCESSLNLVLLYLLLIELNEASKTKIVPLMLTLSDKKTSLLISLFRKTNAITKLYELGVQIWDVEYVKEILKSVLEKFILEEVYETVASHEQKFKKDGKKVLTVPVGPKCANYVKKYALPPTSIILTPPGQSRIPIMIRASKIPISTYVRPIHQDKIKEACLKNREEAVKKYQEAQKNAFKCANTEKSDKFKKLNEDTEAERITAPIKKISWNKIKFKEVQLPKKTAAVILREGARLLKLEESEIKRYEDLANGGFNNDLITEWEKEIREETFRKHIEDIEKKHLEGLLSYEEALIAKQKCLKKKKEKAIEFRKEKENWLNQLEIWKKEEQMRIQENFEKGKASEKMVKEAVEQVKEEKHKMALETMEESRTLKERWLKEKEQDLQRKVQLIKEIKALQALGVVRRKQTDFTETPNLGLLYEMSLAELKERLFILKIEVQEELERRRAEVKMRRECRKEIIGSYQELIESHKKIIQEQKQKQRQKQKLECELDDEEKKKTKLMRSSPSLDTLRQKLYEKRRERIKHQTMCETY